MQLLVGLVAIACAVAMVWALRSRDGIHPNPLLERPGMHIVVPLTTLVLLTAGIAMTVSWLLA